MATKTISITEEAYERLKSRKKENESFSEIIKKITNKRSLLEIAGMLSEREANKVEKEIKNIREISNKKVKEIVKSLKK